MAIIALHWVSRNLNLSEQRIPSQGTLDALSALAQSVKTWGKELGFQQIGITDIDLSHYKAGYQNWIKQGFHADMDYLTDHGDKRFQPELLVPGTQRIISARMDYLPAHVETKAILRETDKAYIARYALGRDYHKVIRKRLTHLANKLADAANAAGIHSENYRAFVDSAPILERPLAEKAGLGWVGKNTLILNSKAGSLFLLGEVFTDIPLPIDPPHTTNHCGSCTACIDVCPTKAFVEPYVLDARKCISYLTIENKGAIPEPLRKPIGNRVFGCDDCQLFCPWNKFAKHSQETDFNPRHAFDDIRLSQLFLWDEATFLKNTEGSPIRRTGYIGWLRNLAVGLGNAPTTQDVILALQSKQNFPNELVQEHVTWALAQHHHV